MNFKMIGQRVVCFDAANEGAGGGAPGGAENGGAAHPVVAPWAAAADGVWKVGEGDTAQPWYATIPEAEARAHIEAKGYKNPAELALANYSLTKMQRGDPSVVGLPGQNATDDDWKAFYAKLGRPETPDGYDIKFGEGVTADEAMVKWGKQTFHEAGLTPKQAQAVADKWNAFVAEQNATGAASVAQKNDAELAQLTARWGADLDRNKAAGQRVVKTLGLSDEFVSRIEGQIGSAAVVELLAMIGRKTDEGGFVGGGAGADPNNPETMTKEQATARITSLNGDAEFQKKYTDRNHPGHKDAVELMQRLYARA